MQFKFDKSLILPWSDKLSEEEPYEYPFLASYGVKSKSLSYIATLHSTQEGSETFELVSKTIKEERIELVIVEGIPNASSFSPISISNWATQQGEDGKYKGFETAFTIKTCLSSDIPFIGGEPKEEYIYNELLKKDFTTEDYLFYTFTQQVFQAKEANSLEEFIIEDYFKEYIYEKKTILSLENTYNFEEFQKWFKLNNFGNFSSSRLKPETCAPYESGKLLTQRVSSAMCILRDQFTITVIEKALIKFDNVMIVYGGSHWSTQKVVLSQALGNPKFNKL